MELTVSFPRGVHMHERSSEVEPNRRDGLQAERLLGKLCQRWAIDFFQDEPQLRVVLSQIDEPLNIGMVELCEDFRFAQKSARTGGRQKDPR